MKKFLLLAAVALTSLMAGAQITKQMPVSLLPVRSSSVQVAANVHKVPQKADLNEGQVIVGLFDTDEYDQNGLGLNGNVTIKAGTVIPSEYYNVYTDLKVDAVRFALAQSASIKGVYVYMYDKNDEIVDTPIAYKSYSETCPAGWTTVELDEPVAIPEEAGGVIVCYEIALTQSGYPLAVNKNSSETSFFCYGPFYETGPDWADMGTQYGTLAIQMICECAPAIGYLVRGMSMDTKTVACNVPFTANVTLSSSSEYPVNSIDYTVTFCDKTDNVHYEFNTPIPAGLGKSSQLPLELVATRSGMLPVEFTINKVNDVEVSSTTTTFYQSAITRIVPRYSIVEEFTGTGCGYCPLGWVGMKYVKEHHSKDAGVIAIHQFNSSDAMYVTNYQTPPFGGAPTCRIDRYEEDLGPYEADMDNYLAYFAQFLPEVDVQVKAEWADADKTEVNASAVTEFLTDLEGSELVFVLTADGLSGTTSAWKQANYLASESYSKYANTGSGIADFCKGGKYAQSYVSLVFDDVMIGSSWPSAKAKNEVAAFTTTAGGEKAESTYTLTLPISKTTLMDALHKDDIFVTAMVIKADGMIANAARCRVSNPEGLNTVLAPATTSDEVYDLSGRVVSNAASGIFVKNGKKIVR